MNKSELHRLAKEYVLKHKDEFKTGRGGVTKKEIKAAVAKVEKVLLDLKNPDAAKARFD